MIKEELVPFLCSGVICVFFLFFLFQMLGTRLEELLEQEDENAVTMVTDEVRQRQLVIEDEEEDFMDEGELNGMPARSFLPSFSILFVSSFLLSFLSFFLFIYLSFLFSFYLSSSPSFFLSIFPYFLLPFLFPFVLSLKMFNAKTGCQLSIFIFRPLLLCIAASVNQSGNACPMALKLIACVLLLEITTFLRECYRTLPKPSKLVRYAQQQQQQQHQQQQTAGIIDPSIGRSTYFQWCDSRAQSRDHPVSTMNAGAAAPTGGGAASVVAVVATTGGPQSAGPASGAPGASSSGRRWSMAAQSIAGKKKKSCFPMFFFK